MANTNMELLYPEFWAAGFDQLDKGNYQLQNHVDRQYEDKIAMAGDQVNVPVTPTFAAVDWAPGSAITTQDVAQTSVSVILNKSKSVPFNINGKEATMSAYDLIQRYGIPAAEAILEQVNKDIYAEMLNCTNFIDATGGLSETNVLSARTGLSNNKVTTVGRKMLADPNDVGVLLGKAAFASALEAGDADAKRDAVINRKLGFDWHENHAMDKYTPADVAGLVNNVAGYNIGDTTMLVDAFDDDLNPIRIGDIVVFAGESGTPKHTVTGTSTTASDTTSISFSPPLAATVANDTAVTVTPTRSMLAFVQNAVAFAARPYAQLPQLSGVMSTVAYVQGMPVRITVFHDGKLGLTVQYDALYGVKMVNGNRIQRIITV